VAAVVLEQQQEEAGARLQRTVSPCHHLIQHTAAQQQRLEDRITAS
jgi:hypothetical protein